MKKLVKTIETSLIFLNGEITFRHRTISMMLIVLLSISVNLFSRNVTFQFNSKSSIFTDNVKINATTIDVFLNQSFSDIGLSQEVSELTSWSINGPSLNLNGTGLSIKQVVFSTPGVFNLELHSEHGQDICHHETNSKITINVLPYSIKFDWSKVSFSSKLVSGQNSVVMKVPSQVFAKDGASFPFKDLSIQGSGIGTNLSGKFIDNPSNTLPSEVEFLIEGSCQSGTYIMLDVVFNNAIISSFYNTQKID